MDCLCSVYSNKKVSQTLLSLTQTGVTFFGFFSPLHLASFHFPTITLVALLCLCVWHLPLILLAPRRKHHSFIANSLINYHLQIAKKLVPAALLLNSHPALSSAISAPRAAHHLAALGSAPVHTFPSTNILFPPPTTFDVPIFDFSSFPQPNPYNPPPPPPTPVDITTARSPRNPSCAHTSSYTTNHKSIIMFGMSSLCSTCGSPSRLPDRIHQSITANNL